MVRYRGDTVLPDGSTDAEVAVPRIAEAYRNQEMPPMLPGVAPWKVITLPQGKGAGR